MSNSGDFLLASILSVLIPSLILLFGTIIYSRIIIARYSRVVSRLYQMNFNSLELERKRISNDLHDQFGYKIIVINQSIEKLCNDLQIHRNQDILRIQSQINLFHNDIKRILEFIHPRDLMEGKWHDAIISLAEDLSIGNTNIIVSCNTKLCPKMDHLHHSYRIIQEKLANILAHSNTHRVQIDISDDSNHIIITMMYKNQSNFIQNLHSKLLSFKGRGLSIINDRLKIIGGSNVISRTGEFTVDTISIPL